MPKYQITFPPLKYADPSGLLCIGGNLEPETLINAYSHGIFPWYDDTSPIMWWSPPTRMIMKPSDLKTSKSLRKIIASNAFDTKFDTNFESVISHCASQYRENQDGTWITNEMKNAYIKLHKLGYAHSVETYLDNKLVGGLYGISLGNAFFGESMFHTVSNASKVAFYHLVQKLKAWDFSFIDCQQSTAHLKSLGAYDVKRELFITLLHQALNFETYQKKW